MLSLNLAPQIAFHHIVGSIDFANLEHFLVGQLRHPALWRDADLVHDLLRLLLADAMDIWSAITTRLLVGMFTQRCGPRPLLLLPARAGAFLKIPKLQSIGLRATINASTTPTAFRGRHRA